MKRFRYFILVLVCCMLVSMPVKVMAAETYGLIEQKAPVMHNEFPQVVLTLDNVSPSSDEAQCFVDATYSGTGNYLVWFNDNLEGRIYNGVISHNFTVNLSPSSGYSFISPVSIDVQIDDDYEDFFIAAYGFKYSNNTVSFTMDFNFNYFDAGLAQKQGGSFLIPFKINYSVTAEFVQGTEYFTHMNAYASMSEEGTGLLDVYTSYLDMNDYDGYVVRQNQQVIDGINRHDSNVGGWFADLTNNLSNWFSGVQATLTNFFTPYFDNITDAFKRALSDTQATDNEVLSGAMDDYQSAEQEVFAPAMDSLTDFDFGSNDISSLGTGFIGAITFVSSCLSNMYDLTPFSAVFDVIATLALASICIGMSRLWFGKKGR